MAVLEMEPPLDPCRSYAFFYPGHDRLEPRRLFVTRIYDVHGGRAAEVQWLVTGTDLQRQSKASFQFDAMQDIRPLASEDR